MKKQIRSDIFRKQLRIQILVRSKLCDRSSGFLVTRFLLDPASQGGPTLDSDTFLPSSLLSKKAEECRSTVDSTQSSIPHEQQIVFVEICEPQSEQEQKEVLVA